MIFFLNAIFIYNLLLIDKSTDNKVVVSGWRVSDGFNLYN